MKLSFQYNDGGRNQAGFKGSARDCVARAISIVTGKNYDDVYSAICLLNKERGEAASARNGVRKDVYKAYLASIGLQWTPTMKIGQGCTVHLADNELPDGKLIVCVSKHVTAVINGVIHDTFDPRRYDETGRPTRCVYGYWKAP